MGPDGHPCVLVPLSSAAEFFSHFQRVWAKMPIDLNVLEDAHRVIQRGVHLILSKTCLMFHSLDERGPLDNIQSDVSRI